MATKLSQMVKEVIDEVDALLVRERLFREDFERRLLAESRALIEERIRHYHLRTPVSYNDSSKVLMHTNDGHRLMLDMREPFMTHYLMENGEWEYHVRDMLRSLLPPGGVFLDVGANIGVHSLLAATLVGAAGKVIAVEPHPVTFGLLRENVEINGLLERISVVQKAVSDVVAAAVPFEHFPQHPAMSGFKVPQDRIDSFLGTPETIYVETTTVDELLQPLGYSADLVKIDVEGFELGVLRGARRVLSMSRDTAFLVEHNHGTVRDVVGDDGLRALWDLIQESGLVAFVVKEASSMNPITWEDFGMMGEDLLLVHPGSRPYRSLMT